MAFKKLIIVCMAFVMQLYAVPTYNPMNVTKYPMDIPIYYPMDVTVYPMNGDRDGDGVVNSRDPFPDNPNEWLDTDHDGIGNNTDTDDDNDGIPDSVERANGLNPLNASDANGDLDRDGFSNVIEYMSGTDMRNSRSRPTWAPVIMGDIMMFVPAKP